MGAVVGMADGMLVGASDGDTVGAPLGVVVAKLVVGLVLSSAHKVHMCGHSRDTAESAHSSQNIGHQGSSAIEQLETGAAEGVESGSGVVVVVGNAAVDVLVVVEMVRGSKGHH